ncbi:MAG TPA: aminotransferase class III-fold pyridoxal phosphate-dependent enzyme, partial [Membranihabitans sp.]|nr:aminotransferase class III-fold pyridoxal phosphate-dependent enzyme [Membranihabitans sp.]
GLAVLEIFEHENILMKVQNNGQYLMKSLQQIPHIKSIRGRGMMVAIDFDFPIAQVRKKLIFEKRVFTGSAKSPNTMRLLPPLTVDTPEIDIFVNSLTEILDDI